MVGSVFCPWISLGLSYSMPMAGTLTRSSLCSVLSPLFSGYVKWQGRKWFIEFVFLSLYIKPKKLENIGSSVCFLVKKKMVFKSNVDRGLERPADARGLPYINHLPLLRGAYGQ